MAIITSQKESLEFDINLLHQAMILHHDVSTETTVTLVNAQFSVDATDYPASNALTGSLAQTDSSGVGIAWTADI